MSHELGLASEPLQPLHDVVRVLDAAAEQEQPRLRRGHGDGQLVVQAPVRIGEHLIFVDHQQRRAVAADEPVFLCLQRGDDDGRVEIFAEVTGRDADVPATRSPFGQFVIGQSAGGDGVDGLAVGLAVVGPQLEDQRLARTGRRVDDDILARAQRGHGLLLPQVRDRDLVEGRGFGELTLVGWHAATIGQGPERETGFFAGQANSAFTGCAPEISVRRKSRPLLRKVSLSESKPSACRIVEWNSWTLTLFSTDIAPTSSVEP